MQGRQNYQPELFSVIDIEKLIPKNHLLRKLDRVLDLSFIREMTAPLYCENNGRPSVDPELYFRIQILMYLYNIPSERRACEEVALHLAYRWFCRLSLADEVPDHSSLTKIRERLGEETFKKIFDHIVHVCIEKKIAAPESIMADGTLVKANAAPTSLVEILEGETEEGIKAKEKPKYIIDRKYSNNTHVSQTDPDCRLAGKVGEPKFLRYKAHNIADRKGRVIIDTHVTDGSVPEGTIFLKRLDYIEEHFGIKVADAVADRGYGYGEILAALEKRGVTSFVPNFHADVGGNVEEQGFIYDKTKNMVVCPEGHEMTFVGLAKRAGNKVTATQVFEMKKGKCRNCPRLEQCIPQNPNIKEKNYRKRIGINLYREIQERTKLLEQTPEFKKVRGERQWKMEGLFAEGKTYHGLGRARYRRRHNMQIQAYMIATVQNLKRLLNLVSWIKSILESLAENFESSIFARNFYEISSG